MPRRILTFALTAALIVAAPTVARADLPTNRPLQTARVTESLRIAGEFWQQQPACGVVRVFAATEAALNAGDPEGPARGESVIARSRSSDCTIWISDVLREAHFGYRIETCSDIVHEYGHLLGFRHDDGPLSVMNPVIPTVYGCYHRFLPHGQGWWWRSWHKTVQFAQRPATPE
jgi:hypothetical protein